MLYSCTRRNQILSIDRGVSLIFLQYLVESIALLTRLANRAKVNSKHAEDCILVEQLTDRIVSSCNLVRFPQVKRDP